MELSDVPIAVTIIEMMRDRKYKFHPQYQPDKILEDIKIDSFSDRESYDKAMKAYHSKLQKIPFLGNKLTETSTLPLDSKGQMVYVFFQEGSRPLPDSKTERVEKIGKKVSINLHRAFPDIAGTKDLDDIAEKVHLIIVFNSPKKPDTSKFEEDYLETFNVEPWPRFRLKYNLTKVYVVPQHTLLTAKEVEQYKEKYQVSAVTMEKICLDDPVNRYYYGQLGDVYKIQRRPIGKNARIVIRKTLSSTKKAKSRSY